MQHYKKKPGLFLSQRRFQGIVRSIVVDVAGKEYRWQREGLEALQYGAELFVTDLFYMAQLATIHARRETLMLRDMQLVYEMNEVGPSVAMQHLKADLSRSREKERKKNVPQKKPKSGKK